MGKRTYCLNTPGFSQLCAAALLLSVLTLLPAYADKLYLRDGRVIDGRVRKLDNEYVVTFEKGAEAIIKSVDVVRYEKSLTTRQFYENLRAVYSADSFKDQMALGNWCREHLLPDEAKVHFLKAVELQPNDQKARKAAGFVFHDGKWLTRDEYMRAQGKELYRGKWIDAAEAMALKAKDTKARERREGFAEGWALLRAAAKDFSADNDKNVKYLKDMGNRALDALIKGASDPNYHTRQMTIKVLSSGTDTETLQLLIQRLRFEKKEELVVLTQKQLALRQDREVALRLVLELCVNSEFSTTRKRTWAALRYMADKRAIDKLIPLVSFNPVPESESRMNEELKKTSGTVTIEDYKKARRAYYPAAEALDYLTGARLPHVKADWEKWWEANRETFTFQPLP